jgi:ribosomal protein S27AE
MEQFMHDKETLEKNTADFCKHAYCPWCGRGQTMADATARIRISTQCARCGTSTVLTARRCAPTR